MRKEIELLGALHIAISILYILVSTAIYAVLFSKGFFSSTLISSNMQYVICAVIGAFLLIFAFFGIIAAMGVISEKPWSTMMILILGCLDLVCLPLGTALGIYTILIFMRNEKSVTTLSNSNIYVNKEIRTDQVHSLGMGIQFPDRKNEI